MGSLPLVDLWGKRSLILHFSLMTTKVRYLGTYMGFLWAILEPLFAFVILYLVFSSIRVSSRPEYPIYLLIGILIFQIFTRGTQNGLTSIRTNAGIIKSINIQKEFFPVVSTGSTAIIMCFQLVVFFILLAFLNYSPDISLILLPIPLLLLLIMILGLSYILSIVYVYIKDIQFAWNIFTYALFFVTPIFWYLDEVGGLLSEIQKINPVGQIMELMHKIIFGEIPSVQEWAITSIYCIGIFIVGYIIFKKYEGKIAEEL